MAKAGRLTAGSSLIGFDDVARDYLEGILATYGFFVEMSKVEAHYAMRRFRNGHRYVTVEARTTPGEPPIGRVKLGTGSTEWPEGDWNYIPIWRLIKAKRKDHQTEDYQLDNVAMEDFLDRASKDLQDYAMDFLGGELFTFKRLRSEAAKLRPAYEHPGKGPYCENTLKYMRVSRLLKDKYSSEQVA
jgi:hypothetical protein